jgi:hypothetical protein
MSYEDTPQNQQILLQRAAEIGTAMPVDERTIGIITALEATDGSPRAGSVIRRACMVVGSEACKAVCQRWAMEHSTDIAPATEEILEAVGPATIDEALAADPTACADNNVLRTIETLGLQPEQVLILGVGSDDSSHRVAFLDDLDVRGSVTVNPHGWREFGGYNAVWARNNDHLPGGASRPDAELPLGGLFERLADSGALVATGRRLADGQPVTGIAHITRTNMLGKAHRREYGGVRMSFAEHFLRSGIDELGLDPSTVTVRMIGAVGPESWRKRYVDTRALEHNLRGWSEEGFIVNKTNPNWRPGMQISDPATGERDWLWPQYPQLIERDVREAAQNLGIPDENLNFDGALDPGKPTPDGLVHSSLNRGRLAQPGEPTRDARDLYGAVIVG